MTDISPNLSTEQIRYRQAWNKLRWSVWLSWLLPVTVIPAILLFGWLLSIALHGIIGYGIIAVIWIAGWVMCNMEVGSFRCPRCGGMFFVDSGSSGRNPASGVCMHCGLRKFAEAAN